MENIQHRWYACEPLFSVRADWLVDSVYPAIGARCMNHAGLVAQVVRREGAVEQSKCMVTLGLRP
jgi:hypothetical protein